MTVVPPWSLDGRLAVVTGFGAGIGRATATAFARAGAAWPASTSTRNAAKELPANSAPRGARPSSSAATPVTWRRLSRRSRRSLTRSDR